MGDVKRKREGMRDERWLDGIRDEMRLANFCFNHCFVTGLSTFHPGVFSGHEYISIFASLRLAKNLHRIGVFLAKNGCIFVNLR